jgi:hypothetical protein
MRKLLAPSHYFRSFAQPHLRRFRGVALLLVLLASVGGLVLWTRSASALANNLGSWGTAGSGDGQFSGPLGVAIDLVGNVYVVDSGNNRIQKFNTSGTFIAKWGTAGAGNGQFSNPAGIAVDPSGNVYVADTFNNRIQKFTGAGVFVSTFGESGAGEGQFQHPYAVAADRVGNLFVADSDNHRIQKFDTSGNFLLQWGAHGTGNGLFDNPRGVAVDISGNVYVTDVGNNRVEKFGTNGNYLTQWGSNGSNPGQFSFVAGVVVDTMGFVYVTDAGNNNVQKFTSSGAFAGKLDGSPGSSLNTPFGCAVDSLGNLYVSSNGSNQIVKLGNHGPEMYWTQYYGSGLGQVISIAVDKPGDVYTATGTQILKFHTDGTITSWGGQFGSGDGQFGEPFGIAFDSVGNVYVTDMFYPRVQVFTPDGVYVRQFAIPGGSISRGIALDRFDNVYIADEGTNSVRKLTNSGSLIVEWGGGPQTLGVDGKFYTPQGVAIDYAGNVYVTDLGNDRVQVFDENGNFLSKFGSLGTGNGQMWNARGLGVDLAGNIYVADTLNHRTEKFTPRGVFYETWGSHGSQPGQYQDPFGAAVDTLGNVVVVDTQNGRLQKFSQGAPVANAGTNQLFNCVKTPSQAVTLDASGTTDPTPNDTREYQWSEGTTYLGSGQTLTYPLATGGEHVVTLVVTDGDNYSSVATVHVKVNAYNHTSCNTAPVANDDTPASINEDSLATTIDVLTNDTDYDNDSLSITSTTSPAHGSVHVGGGGTNLTYTPSPDYFGSDSFTYSISDGHGGTSQANVNLTVNPVNDPPSFSKGANQTVNEDAGAQTVVGWATNISKGPANEASQTVDFIVTNDNNALFSAQPAVAANGTLSYTPAADANGIANITVKVHDDGGGNDTSAPQTFTITVNAVNDPPSFSKGADQTFNEDAGPQTVAGWATNISDGPNETGQTLTFNVTVTGTTANLAFTNSPAIDAATGNLTFTTAPDSNGTASVSVTLSDNGSNTPPNSNTSAPQTFQITVNPVNDPPSFSKGANQTVNEDSGAQTVVGWATNISKGPANESNQTVDFIVTNDNNALFSAQPLVTANGTLTYTPAADANGIANVSVKIHDDGGGNDTSASQTFTVTVNAVNDPPSFTKGASQAVNEDSGAQIVVGWATNISKGPANESNQTVDFIVTNDNNALFSAQPLVAANGTLSYTPAADVNGIANVTVKIHDDGGGDDTSAPQTFTITVNAVNDPPSFTKGANQIVDEDSGAQTVVGWATNISKGPANESNQTVDFIVTSDNNALFSTQPAVAANGTLTYTPAADANGIANVSVKIHDDGGGNDTSAPQTFTITVNAVNDPPSFVKGADQTVSESSGPQTVTGWATSISQGPNESGQTPLIFNVTVTGTAGTLTFGTAPAIDGTTGTLTYAVNDGTNGTANVSVTLSDSGSNTPPNVNTSAAQTFQIKVGAVNNAPVNTVPGSQHMPQDTVLSFTGSRTISVSDSDAAETPSDGVITVSLSATNGTLKLSSTAGLSFSAGDGVDDASMSFDGTIPAINAALNGMTFTPNQGFNGAAGIEILTSDQGKTGSGGVKTDDDTIQITVDPLAAIYLNEVAFIPDSSGQNQYLEFRGAPDSVIPAGTYFVVIDGASTHLGAVKTLINLSGLSFGSNGFLVLLQNGNSYSSAAGATVLSGIGADLADAGFGGLPGNIYQAAGGVTSIENGSATFMLIQTGVAPALGDKIDTNDDGVADGSVYSGWSVRDSVGHVDGDSGDHGYGLINYSTSGSSSSSGAVVPINFVSSYLGRRGDTSGAAASDWVASSSLAGAAPNFALNASVNAVEPSSYAGKPLNHIGASNFADSAPVNSVPGVQTINEDTPLIFSGPNQISIADSDAGNNDVQVTLTAVNGSISLSGTANLAFTIGAGTGAQQMRFTGKIVDINNSLNNLTFTPSPNFFSPPNAGLTIVTDDLGNTGFGGPKSATDTIQINVNAVNHAPSFTRGPDAIVNEDAGPQTVAGWASNISAGPNETGQTLTFTAVVTGTTGNLAFTNSPAIDAATGNLKFTTAPDTNGTATVSVTLSDNGSNTLPNSNTSAPQTFQITVNPVNDAPTFQLNGNPPAISQNAGAQAVNNFAANFKPGPATATDESTQTLIGYSITQKGATGNLTFSNAPAIDPSGKLTYTPAANTSGTATFSVVATDSGSGIAPNINQSSPITFTITVNGGGSLQFSNTTYGVSENAGPAVLTITRTGGSSGLATVQIASSDGTAIAGSDYTALSQTVTFNDGETTKNVNLPIIDDLLNEPDETVNLTLSNVTGSGQLGTPATAVLTIMNDDPVGGYVRFSTTDFHVNEGDGLATITVERLGSLEQPVTIDYATADDSTPAALVPCGPTPGNNLATSRCDYNTTGGKLSWASGDGAAKTFTVLINQDSYVEGPESVSLTLSNPTGGAELISPSTATLTIADDVSRTTNPLDDSDGFVRQHYHDFLNREADPAGLAFWKNNIDRCNDPAQRLAGQTLAQCIELARINTSAAFFLSIEFQTTGGTAYLTNKVVFGGPPAFLRFQTDAQLIGRDYVVGQPGADAILEANKVAYFNALLARPEVVNSYAGLTDQVFVDTLIGNTGITFAQAERDVLLNGLLNHTETRATVLRKIVEKPEFRQAEFNQLFVLMEYFAYLRRDADVLGFTYWLAKLNSVNGDYLKAEMVKAFLSSSEYRQRFGN